MVDQGILNEATLPEARSRRKRISPVWLVPFIALAIAVALGVRAWQQKGEEIEIIFDTAGGIEVGKTEVRLKDVPVGKVSQLKLSQDLSQVHAVVTLDRSMSHHLSEHTRFWLVTPRISTSGVSNLGTLVSGVYIVMDPGQKGSSQDSYKGLSEPPAVQSDEKGTQYVLRAESLGSLDVGSPVYFRQLRVGEVVNYQLSMDGGHVDARVFIEAPYDQLVSVRSRFWNVSGFDVSIGMDGVTAQMASISSLLLGGVSFESPAIVDDQSLADADHTFALYDNKKSAEDGLYTLSYAYTARFSHSVKGLKVGAPIEFRGLKVGRVGDIYLEHVEQATQSLAVTLLLEPQRFDEKLEPSREELNTLLGRLVEQGMRAEIKSSNPLLGSKYIDLNFIERAEGGTDFQKPLAEGVFPTLDQPLDLLEQQIASVAAALSRFPTEDIGSEMAGSLKSLNEILTVFRDQKTAQALHGTLDNVEQATKHLDGTMVDAREMLAQLTVTLKSVDHSIAPDSQMHAEFLETLQAVTEASDSFDRFVEELYRYPSSLVFGLGKDE